MPESDVIKGLVAGIAGIVAVRLDNRREEYEDEGRRRRRRRRRFY